MEIEMTLKNMKMYFFEKYKFCNIFSIYVTKSVFFEKTYFVFPNLISLSFKLFAIVIPFFKAMNIVILVNKGHFCNISN